MALILFPLIANFAQAYKPTKRQTYTIFKKSFFHLKYDEIKLQLFIYIKILDF